MKTATRLPLNRNGAVKPATVKVAIYCRVSTDEKLAMEFNSLEAQRLAVESFVALKASDGWVALPDRFDDGGFTGANTDRPAFQRLLTEIEAGNVDLVAVQRIDRLSRSLLDFLQLMQMLERHGVSFISTTQPLFDTASSSGRLMLNILMSFASYERELIGERTASKMGAARRKGHFVGGPIPMGYALQDKKLIPHAEDAKTVREVFQLFLQLGSVMATVEELNRRGISARGRGCTSTGTYNVKRWEKYSLRHLLTNVVYVARIRYRGELFDGVHQGIVDPKTFEAAQRLLRKRPGNRRPQQVRAGSLLAGHLVCGQCGGSMTSHYAQKHGRRYGSYVCLKAQKEGAASCPGSRIPARELERFVIGKIKAIGKDPALLMETLAATREQVEAQRPLLEDEIQRLEAEKAQLTSERQNLLEAVAKSGSNAGLLGKLGAVEGHLAKTERLRDKARQELDSLDGKRIDEDALRQALEAFDPIWSRLEPREQARVLQILVETVTFDAGKGEIEIRFRPGGPTALLTEGDA